MPDRGGPSAVPEAARAVAFDRVFGGLLADGFLLDTYRRVYGGDHPGDVEVFSSCTRDTLRAAVASLRVRPGGCLVDLGCGLGGPGRWLAGETGARLVGVDFSRIALEAADRAAAGALEVDRYEYRLGTFTATGLLDAHADAVVSIDALPMAADRLAALVELRRILRPGGRAFFTCTEWHGSAAPHGPRFAVRWAKLVADAGLELVASRVDAQNRDRWLALYDLWRAHEAEIRRRCGGAADDLLHEARRCPETVLVPGYRALELTVERPRSENR